MYDTILLRLGSATYPVTACQIVSLIAAALCLVEMVRVALMIRIMIVGKVKDREPVVFNCLLTSAILLLVLGGRSLAYGLFPVGMAGSGLYSLLNSMPIILFIYLLRISNKLIWTEAVFRQYDLRSSKQSKEIDKQCQI